MQTTANQRLSRFISESEIRLHLPETQYPNIDKLYFVQDLQASKHRQTRFPIYYPNPDKSKDYDILTQFELVEKKGCYSIDESQPY